MADLKKKPGKKRKWNRDDTELTILAFPTAVWYLLFSFLPMFGIIIAFKKYTINGGFLHSILTSAWCGLDNFKFLFSSGDIWMILRNTILYNITFIILNIVVPVTMALLIGQIHNQRMAKVFQTAMFLPYFLSWVVVTALVWAFLRPRPGSQTMVHGSQAVAGLFNIYVSLEKSGLQHGRVSGYHYRNRQDVLRGRLH